MMVSLMTRLSLFTIRMKIKGESGLPCLTPLEGEEGLEGMPMTMMENRVDEVRLTIQETQEGSKPKAISVSFK
jgi:hypothetical protein